MRSFRKSTLGAVLLLLSGFSGRMTCEPQQNTSDTLSVFFGYIDTEQVSVSLEWVDMLRVDTEPEEVITLKARDGIFWGEGISTGTYRYMRFGGSDSTGAVRRTFLFPPEGVSWEESGPDNPAQIPPDFGQRKLIVSEPAVYYLGSRRITSIGTTRHRVMTTGKPTEKEIIEKLLIMIEKPGLKEILKKRLAEIG